jgi:hypothetical protein
MNKADLEEQYAALSTNELLEILDRKFDYTDLAVAVAIAEISKREISEETVNEYKDLQIARTNESIRKVIIDDLKVGYKIFFFFIWVPLLNFPLKQNYRDGDFVLKLSQASYYSGFGFAFMMLTGMVSGFYDLSNLTAITIWFGSFLPVYAFDEFFNRRRLMKRLMRHYDKNDVPDING